MNPLPIIEISDEFYLNSLEQIPYNVPISTFDFIATYLAIPL